MKKFVSTVLIFALMLFVLTACSNNNTSSDNDTSSQQQSQDESSAVDTDSSSDATTDEIELNLPEQINVAGLKGPTSIGMVKLMDDAENSLTNAKYNFSIYGSADEIVPLLTKGELDIAAIPSNLASVLYNNTNGKVKLIGINTLGVTYIVENGETVNSVSDLKGKTVYCTGKGSVPEYSLRYILMQNGIDPDKDVTLEFKSEPTEIVSVMQNNEDTVAMLPMPYVFVAASSVDNYRIAIDLNEQWNQLDTGSQLITGVFVVREEFLNQYPDAVSNFLFEASNSVSYINENVNEAAELVEKYDIFKAKIAQKAIPKCNITLMSGDNMKQAYSKFINIIFEQNPKAVGGVLPDDNFYYE